ncbi:MAG: phosphoadenosine phosphosulfate reductase family protein [Oscillospiraceae bacterium]|jgi:phosphoadenosine phosphosulfate reductase|nr:phosphoadenosine phosphosulfate reductase family protein [Oscillospiraceae bacterium]
MYSYTHDPATGGLLLNSTPTGYSKEPRPVYAPELDLLGFGAHWNYDKQTDTPYLWAEHNEYWYRGRLVAKLKGGNLYEAPELILFEPPEPDGVPLRPIDIPAMCEKNRELLEVIETATVKRIVQVYEKYKDKLDLFHVAFSGGKDSCVLLDLVKKSLPKGSFVVVFGDTGMEFPDTYDVIDKTEEMCKAEEIPFYRAASHLTPEESWKLFGPPSRTLRWCCSVHKSTPQALALRAVNHKYAHGLSFVGIRNWESILRSEMAYETDGEKVKGMKSFNPIIEWTSAEIWLYIYFRNTLINPAYVKGNARAGCVFCPMSAKTDYLKNAVYAKTIAPYIKSVGKHYQDFDIINGYWSARTNGLQLSDNEENCKEWCDKTTYYIEVKKPKTDWRVWIKTIGQVPFLYTVTENADGYVVQFNKEIVLKYPSIVGHFKKVFHKAAYCIGCRVCESNCKFGCITFAQHLRITDCKHCQECNQLDGGCLVYNSRRHPVRTGDKQMKQSVDCFGTHTPKTEWFESLFSLKDKFVKENSLGSEQKVRFLRYVRAIGLMDCDRVTPFAHILDSMAWDSHTSLGLILINSAYYAQIQWYIRNLEVGRPVSRTAVQELLRQEGHSEFTSKTVSGAFKRFVLSPFGTKLGFGITTDEKDYNLLRTKCTITDPRVVLYGLYKFAEGCGGFYQFTLTRLLDYNVEADGISPTQIFGLEREDMVPLLQGLAAKYPDFIGVTFTHDLDKITLESDKNSADVLELFKED